jgi:hypothetical protein
MAKFIAIGDTPNTKKAHPMGFVVKREYANVDNFIRYAMRKATPGQYRICLVNYDAAEYTFLRYAYVKV